MEQIPCFYCGSFFDPSPRHKNQTACKKEKCQKAKKAAWQRHRMKTDPIYAANQKSSNQQWVNAKPGYPEFSPYSFDSEILSWVQ